MPLDAASTWSTFDQLAVLVVATLATGYAIEPIRLVVVTAVSGLVGPVSVWLPFSAIVFLLGGAAGVVSAVARSVVRDAERAEQARERAQELRERLRDATDSDHDLPDVQRELRTATLTALAENTRPMIWSALVSIPAFFWLRWAVASPAAALAPAAVVVPAVGPVAWTATVVGPIQVWLGWYLVASFSTGVVARRVVNALPVGS